MNIIDAAAFVDHLRTRRADGACGYLAMYSTWLGGMVTDPALMLVPVDDHMVHRGDAVFEMFKCVEGGIYNMGAHLDRLEHSMAAMQIAPPLSREAIHERVIEMLRTCGVADAAIRVYVSRGPGSFGVNPYDCPESQCYIVITERSPSFMESHPEGARIGVSAIGLKEPAFATVKTCNYLPNAMMKKEAVDRGLDFLVAFDERGFLAEGATENMGIITSDHELWFPHPGRILRGTTMDRVMALAESLVGEGKLKAVRFADIAVDRILGSPGAIIVGTTTDVTHVRSFDAHEYGDPGEIFAILAARLQSDMLQGAVRTPVRQASG